MSVFRVGQRVRIVRTVQLENASLRGREARVSQVCDFADGRWYGLDCSPITYTPDGKRPIAWSASQLEPIIPEGAAPSEFTTLADLLSSLEVTA